MTQYFEARRKVYPRAIWGTFRSLKWVIMLITLGIYYLAPWIRWDRGEGRPDQAILVDFTHSRFYFFFIEIWPQEVYYFTGLLIVGALVVFLLNSLFGRVWCGYSCPQTVWTDLFLSIERWVEGDRNKRMRQDQQRWRSNVISKKLLKYTLFLLVSLATGGAWVFYFADAPTLLIQFFTLTAPLSAWIWLAIFTGTTFVLGGFMREQVCIYMCPWPRIQAAMTDDEALNVTYRYDRGEPRNSLKARETALTAGDKAGDCIDCLACVAVCPMGVDIREGLQLACIHCALCIDACNDTMSKVGLPRGLIGYDTDKNIARRQAGEGDYAKLIRPRSLMYVAILSVVTGIMLYGYLSRWETLLTVQRERNPLYVTLSDGSIRNDYRLNLSNRSQEKRLYHLALAAPSQGLLKVTGHEVVNNSVDLSLAADEVLDLRVEVIMPKLNVVASQAACFTASTTTRKNKGEIAAAPDFFKGPLHATAQHSQGDQNDEFLCVNRRW